MRVVERGGSAHRRSGGCERGPAQWCGGDSPAEDVLDALVWAESVGGLPGLVERSRRNLEAVAAWAGPSDWVDMLARDPATRSSTSICLRVTTDGDRDTRSAHAAGVARLLESESVAYDIGAYRDAPPGLRLWGGATVDTHDLETLFPWLDWAHDQATPAS